MSKSKVAPKDRPLTRQQAAFVEELLTNKRATKTTAYKAAYNTSNMKPNTIHREAYATARLPQVMSRLADYSDLTEQTMINTLTDWGRENNSRKREIALNQAQFMHDKIHGKATQRVEQSTQQVTISIDLTGQEDDTDTAQTTG